MSIWQDLYKIFDTERNRWQKQAADTQALHVELKTNLAYLADALSNDIDHGKIIEGLGSKYFEIFIKQNTNFNSLQKKSLQKKTIGDFAEFEKYLGKDTQFMIRNVYSKVYALRKLKTSSPKHDYSLRLKALFRFMMLTLAHIDGKSLKRKKSFKS